MVIAIVGFVFYRLRQFRRESRLRAQSPGAQSPGTQSPGTQSPDAGPGVAAGPPARPKPHSHRAGKNDRSDAEVG